MPSTIDTHEQAEAWASERLLTKIHEFARRHRLCHLIAPRILTPLGLPHLEALSSSELETVHGHLQLLTLYPT